MIFLYMLELDIWTMVVQFKVHGANMGHTWGRQDPGGPHDGPMNCAIWDNYNDMSSMVLVLSPLLELL